MTNPDDLVLLSSCMFDKAPSSGVEDSSCTSWNGPRIPNWDGECWKPSSCTSGVTRIYSGASKPKGSKVRKGRPIYKHVPHREKPPQIVARRNARERRRVQAVNIAFSRLRKVVPIENRGKRVSKVKTLHKAIEYIAYLKNVLEEADCHTYSCHEEISSLDPSLNKENSESNTRWNIPETAYRMNFNQVQYYEDILGDLEDSF